MSPTAEAASRTSVTELVRLSVVVVVAIVAQQSVADAVRLHGAHVDLLLLVTVAAGYVGGPDQGAGIGFTVGLVADLFVPTTFGLSALVDCLLGYAAGQVGELLASSGLAGSLWWPAPLVLAGGAAAGTTAYGILAGVLGLSHVAAFLPAAVLMTTLGGLVCGPLVMAAVRWAIGSHQARSATIGRGGSASSARAQADIG